MFPPSPRGVERSKAETARQGLFARAPFASCHAATLAAADGQLVAAWFAGSEEGAADVAIWCARRDGSGWTPPLEIARGISDDGAAVASWNPVLWAAPSGTLHLFFKAGLDPRRWWGVHARSQDFGLTWTEPERLPDGFLGPIKNKPLLLSGGRLLCPSSTEGERWQVHFEWTEDAGKNWTKSASVGGDFDIIQPTLLALPGGRLKALCRSRQRVIVELISDDEGENWSAPRASALLNPNSAIDALTLKDGRHLLVYNPSDRCRSPLLVALSEDAERWRDVGLIEAGGGEFSYPAIIEGSNGIVHIAYTDQRRTIGYVALDPRKL
jgi:predicted neuraminidase